MLTRLLIYLAVLLILIILLHTSIRMVRRFYKFPMPHFLANAIDNPLRRRLQPPQAMIERLGVRAGMRVLEIGPGNGRYSMAAGKEVGEKGSLLSIDIEPRMIQRLSAKVREEKVENIHGLVANVHSLPWPADSFDLIYMIAVIGELPAVERAMEEFRRVLKPGGMLSFGEIVFDPDYPLAGTLSTLAAGSGFVPDYRSGNFLSYVLRFRKPVQWAG